MDPRSDNLSAPSASPREPVHALDDITGAIVDAALRIHMGLGPGLLESVYEVVLVRALEKQGFRVERQKAIRFGYDGMIFEEGFRTDLLVEGRVVVEL
jgi:iron complex transport system substrate-binding protein